MDGCSSKRGVATKGCNAGSRDAKSNRDQNVHFCNRIGCNGRIKYANQNMKPESSEKAKSSKSGSMMTREKSSSHLDSKRKLSSQLGFDQSESSQSGDSEDRSRTSHRSGSTNIAEQVWKNGSVASSVRSRKEIQPTLGSSKQNTQTASARNSSGLRSLNTSSRSSCLKCNSISSDASPPSCSSTGSRSSKDVTKKRSLQGERSVISRTRQTTAAATSSSGRVSSSSASRRSSSSCTSAVSPSARTGGSVNANKSRMSLSNRPNGRNIRESEPPRPVGRARLPHPSSGGSSSNDDSQSMYSRLVNLDFLQRYNMDDIDEVLLALESIEQDGEMTHEQILALETSLFLSGLNLYDQHRDMRLDIDNMSYEELLALGDRMGTVSTALSEEELLKCVKRSVYEATPLEVVVCEEAEEDGDDVKCSICQEEYVEGDEIGEMVECHHAYHVHCVNQWLRMKNWCPICKTAAPPP